MSGIPLIKQTQFNHKHMMSSESSLQELNGTALQQFVLKKMGRSWDEMTDERAKIDCIDRRAIDYFLRRAIEAGRIDSSLEGEDTAAVLESLKLIGADGCLTNAAILLFGKDPQRFFPSAVFRIGRFGADETDLMFQDSIEGNILQMGDKVVQALRANYLISPISYRGMQRIEKLEVPEAALREIVYNSIVHRQYGGPHTQMRVYADQVELWNYGGLPGGLSEESLKEKHGSFPRNNLIASVFYKAGFIETWGRGINKICTAFAEAGIEEPTFKESCGGVLVTFKRAYVEKTNLLSEPASAYGSAYEAEKKAYLCDILKNLLELPAENELVEFKRAENGFGDQELGKYFSALSNEANLRGAERAWIVFGVEDKSHTVVGTNYKRDEKSLQAVKKTIADQTTYRISFQDIHAFNYEGKRVVMFEIAPTPAGLPMAYAGHYYGRDGESLVPLNAYKYEKIRSQSPFADWSAEIVRDATMDDLDPEALAKARSLYAKRHPHIADEIASWSDITFLNKAKITIRGQITRAAILLLGKSESEVLLSPAVAKIKWILKGANGMERDYAIETCPFVLAVDRIYDRIRNLKYRYINPEANTLFPEELDTYEPYVIREAINNAVAHQDYALGGQINVVEYDDKLVFSNKGSFIPGTIENVLEKDAPEEHYRNPFLALAMVGLGMVDTIGSGIRNMCTYQKNRLFPLPYYNISGDRVEVVVIGKIVDMNYAALLFKNPDLPLTDIELLNRIQLGKSLSKEELKSLRDKKLIAGRMSNPVICKDIAHNKEQDAANSKSKKVINESLERILMAALKERGKLSKDEIKELLWSELPEELDDKQKENKISNMLSGLRKQGRIENNTSKKNPIWSLGEEK